MQRLHYQIVREYVITATRLLQLGAVGDMGPNTLSLQNRRFKKDASCSRGCIVRPVSQYSIDVALQISYYSFY